MSIFIFSRRATYRDGKKRDKRLDFSARVTIIVIRIRKKKKIFTLLVFRGDDRFRGKKERDKERKISLIEL